MGCDQRRVFLELGSATAGTLAYLRGFRCCLAVADAAEELLRLGSEGPEVLTAQRLKALLPDGLDEPVDAVFCWDLLNYLSQPALAALGRLFSEIVRPDGLVHALVQTRDNTIPDRPGRYAAMGAETLFGEAGESAATRAAPRYTPWDLEKYCGNLVVDRSVMLRNGMQEYLLRVTPDAAGPREIPALYRSGGEFWGCRYRIALLAIKQQTKKPR
ncbi:hypothetical protein CAI21_10415 [Alkalilimnicola ehrlichii]|uniref:Methyltransferase type 11 domain-containing protein n=2 Tax=Alkalilimnicola ehrlichii TaxID=351052 RepID=A0A3E0WVY2_9GAMM|nr:hypothetical protein CAI21_10415 [Alkalilimnicola ehrlichii]RFA36087.1 hypothetical protein CAL65_11565 [Alkalilimnicola ehrlichii]